MLTSYCVTLSKLVNISEHHVPNFKMEKQYLLHGIAVRTKWDHVCKAFTPGT